MIPKFECYFTSSVKKHLKIATCLVDYLVLFEKKDGRGAVVLGIKTDFEDMFMNKTIGLSGAVKSNFRDSEI